MNRKNQRATINESRSANLTKELQQFNRTVARAVKNYAPPENLTVSEWADKYRRLSPETSAEAGPWKTSRVPYMREVMDAFTDPRVHRIAVAASSQVAKTEVELNMIGYAIDIDPGPMLFVLPTVEVSQDLSKRRIAPMIRDTKSLRKKVSDSKSRDANNTILKKVFPGGMLTITGSNSPASLASIPARYVFGDERDRWAISAGTEGDPWSLAEARTITFYNAKLVEVSTPTIKGESAIESSFEDGTRERWCHQCPECGTWHQIVFANIKIKHKTIKVGKKKEYLVEDVWWSCPECGIVVDEPTMRRQPAKWIAENPDAYTNGFRSFWINSFSSPWMPWKKIAYKFLKAQFDPEKLKVVYNTIFGELWEDRGDLEDEDSIMARRELYGAEVPEGVLVLTCGVDVQDNRLEYEVVGHGLYKETWGIKKGVIWGAPDTPEVWERLDDVIDKTYFYADGKKGLTISMTCIDSGGHYTKEVYKECRDRQSKRVFAIHGQGGDGIPFTRPAKQTKIVIDGTYIGLCWLYTLGVDAGKSRIMNRLKVQRPGPKYCHFPLDEGTGYDADFFNGLLSEKLTKTRVRGREKWMWVKLPGHNRNEALDCRNYALAAFSILDVDMDAVARRARGIVANPKQPQQPSSQQRPPKKTRRNFDDW